MPTPGLCGINWLAQAQAAQLYDCRGIVMLVIEEGQGQDGLAAPREPLSLAPWLLFFILYILFLYDFLWFSGPKAQNGLPKMDLRVLPRCAKASCSELAPQWLRNSRTEGWESSAS